MTETKKAEPKTAGKTLTDTDLLWIIQSLTEQKTSQNLKLSLKILVEGQLPGSRLEISEIRTVRNADYKQPDYLVSLDALNPNRQAIEITKLEGFEKAVNSKKTVALKRGSVPCMIFPVAASAKASVTHLIVFGHDGVDEASVTPIFECFGNLLALLRSKDRDPLTGFLNRHAFNRIMSEIEINSRGNTDYAADERPYTALAMMDIDHFKAVNDTYGHLIGDETLLIFSQEIRHVFRFNDIIARYGGEEFIVILKEVDASKALLVLERCRERVANRLFPQVEHVTVSIGFADVTNVSPPMLALDRADKALYYAKEHGRNRVCAYEELVAKYELTPIEERSDEVELWG